MLMRGAGSRRTLAHSVIEISPLAWGMWRTTDTGQRIEDVDRLLHAALDSDINLVDTADIYGFDGTSGFGSAEELLGQVLAGSEGLRNRIVLATKGGIRPGCPYDQSPAYLKEAIDASLRRLRVDHIDIYQIHRPDILAHPQETARALEDGLASGKIRAFGVSNHTPSQIEALAGFLDTPLSVTQPEISVLRIDCFENGELDQAIRMGLTPLAWSPLGGGRLLNPQNECELAVASSLDRFARDRGVSLPVAAYSWLMAHPAGIVPIIGSQNADRIAEAVQALDVKWSRGEWYEVFTAARAAPLP